LFQLRNKRVFEEEYKGDINRRSCRPQIENMQLDTQPAMKSAAVAMLMTPLPNEEFSFVSNWIDS
jgi:hypothetical protein